MHSSNLPDGMKINKTCNICETAKKPCVKCLNHDGSTARRCERCKYVKFSGKGCLYLISIPGKHLKGDRLFCPSDYDAVSIEDLDPSPPLTPDVAENSDGEDEVEDETGEDADDFMKSSSTAEESLGSSSS